jgi:hypothetical protein
MRGCGTPEWSRCLLEAEEKRRSIAAVRKADRRNHPVGRGGTVVAFAPFLCLSPFDAFGGELRLWPGGPAHCSTRHWYSRASRLAESHAIAWRTVCAVCRCDPLYMRARRFFECSRTFDLLQAAADRHRLAGPSRVQSQLPVWSTVRRAYLRERGEFPHARTRRPA